ncbi:MAG: 2-oxo-4-hydroxy-4-carboxy-5-ureidoimidazoline decarboxylase [Synechococcales cyanobacterium T60_A2020_003]|nr:2-oxo-4-hydroxy-4-carboxy-5-ureidoimidazoline decarboxylase [Synechococcales cyanobacterium T60_A2020_003]
MVYSLHDINQMSQDQFVQVFGSIFEHTPAIAAQAWEQRPFEIVDDLYQAMITVVDGLSADRKLALVCVHPDLGSNAKIAKASVQEQSSAGLDRLSPAEYERFQRLNQAYKEKFKFPFIIAVRNHTKESILAAFEERLNSDPATELQQALTEIKAIAKFRLETI